ncbi:putative vesicular integral-membrane protein vip36 protein [Botrytis fragariae]|uniref:Putative vesicular integral-membrane protein vip36 protein n=1 Tax=Botrytis fragariae TaxID=1964551 RepID=A0A8H6AQ76_9HELO|nr:putative vesicular integral-membrane protein vip36 protein [Botrytis fragariae]KAF5871483.1 putative vesicular integral-membrane protein vip36 protein [Botrytis fragariae]
MWFPKSLSALWLASCVMAAGDTQTTKLSEDGIRSIPLRTHSLNQPYLDSDMQSRWFDFGGNTIVRADKYIRLTYDHPSSSGWLFSRVPLTATNWEIEVEFKVHGQGNLHGDGFAMWLTKQRGIQGDVFGSVDKFEGLGIFFDTYKNNRPGTVFPYVMAMVGDGNTAYDKSNDGKDQEYMGCSARGLRNANVPTKAKLTYFQDKSLKLELQYKKEDQWELCFETFEPPTIPSVAYLGFSAETGELSDNHDIISVNTNNLYDTNTHKNKYKDSQPKPENGKSRSQKGQGILNRKKKPAGSWSWFFVKCIIGLVVLGGGYVGYTAWRTSQRRSHRF